MYMDGVCCLSFAFAVSSQQQSIEAWPKGALPEHLGSTDIGSFPVHDCFCHTVYLPQR